MDITYVVTIMWSAYYVQLHVSFPLVLAEECYNNQNHPQHNQPFNNCND